MLMRKVWILELEEKDDIDYNYDYLNYYDEFDTYHDYEIDEEPDEEIGEIL